MVGRQVLACLRRQALVIGVRLPVPEQINMIDERFVILGAIVGFIGTISYLRSTIQGITKPNRVSWFLWALAPLVAFVAELRQGVGIYSLMTFTVGFGPFCVFIVSFLNKKSFWKITKFDWFCGALSIIGFVLWQITKIENLVIIFSIFSDGMAAVPTIVKSWKAPETENYKSFLASIFNSGMTLLAIKTWNFAYYAFPVYIFSVCFLLVILIKFKLGKIISKAMFKQGGILDS